MAGILETIGEKLGLKGGGDKMQYLLVGALALVIIIAIVVIITNVMGGGKKGGVVRDQHYWDLATNTEIVITPEDFRKNKKPSMPSAAAKRAPATTYMIAKMCQKSAI